MVKYKKQIYFVSVVIVFLIYILTICPRTMQNDTFWSIKVGEKIANEGIFGLDNFSMHDDLYYVAHHFLTDILIYLVHGLAGFTGLYALEVILAFIMAGLLYLLNKEISDNNFISLIMLFLQLIVMSMYIAVRAQMISFILFELELIFLERYIKNIKKRYIAGLSIIPILLANFHMGAVPFYFVILGTYMLSLIKFKIPFLQYTEETDKVRIKQLMLVMIIGGITIFINPYFIDGVMYPFKTFGNEFINSTIAEFQTLSISFYHGIAIFYIAIIIFILIVSKTKIKTKDFLLLFGTLFMAFMANRYVSLFIICSSVSLIYLKIALKDLRLKSEDLKAIKVTCTVIIAILVLSKKCVYKNQSEYVPENIYPVKAVEYIKDKIGSSDRIFNYYTWGSYLMLNNIQVYIDSRCDLYTEEYNGKEIATDYNKLINCDNDYIEIIEKYNINMFIIQSKTPLETLLRENEKFQMIYRDDIAVIYKEI